MLVLPTDLAVALAGFDSRLALLLLVVPQALLAAVLILVFRGDRGRWFATLPIVLAAVLAVLAAAAFTGTPRPVDGDYLAARFGDGTQAKVEVLASWMRKDVGIALLVRGHEDDPDAPPEYLMLPWDPQLARQIRATEQAQKEMERRGLRGSRRVLNVAPSRPRRGEARQRYRRNFERRYELRYEIEWPPAPPPKQETPDG